MQRRRVGPAAVLVLAAAAAGAWLVTADFRVRFALRHGRRRAGERPTLRLKVAVDCGEVVFLINVSLRSVNRMSGVETLLFGV